MLTKEFLLAGEAIFTVEHPATAQRPAGWFTYRVQHVPANERWAASWFVKVLVGPSNADDYVTDHELKAALAVLRAVADAIRELGSVPSGHLYAQLMGHMSLERYQQIIAVLVRSGMVQKKGHLLTWVGPAAAE